MRADVMQEVVGERARARACARMRVFVARELCANVATTLFGRAILRARARVRKCEGNGHFRTRYTLFDKACVSARVSARVRARVYL